MTPQQLTTAMARIVARRDDCIKQAQAYRRKGTPGGERTAERYDQAAAGFDSSFNILRRYGAPTPTAAELDSAREEIHRAIQATRTAVRHAMNTIEAEIKGLRCKLLESMPLLDMPEVAYLDHETITLRGAR